MDYEAHAVPAKESGLAQPLQAGKEKVQVEKRQASARQVPKATDPTPSVSRPAPRSISKRGYAAGRLGHARIVLRYAGGWK